MGRKPLNAQDLDRELDEMLRPKAAALHAPLNVIANRRLTDDEIMMRGETVEAGEFDVPEELVPDGFVYQWFRTEVFGQPDNKSITNAERNGWRAVPASRHSGIWTPSGQGEGRIEVNGQLLMELPESEAYNRTRYLYLKAKAARQNGQEMLGKASPGQGPRTHPGVRPQVSRTVEQLPVDL